MKEPTKPRTISAMQPNPRPRAIFPASQPAIRPIRRQPITPFRYWIMKTWESARRKEKQSGILASGHEDAQEYAYLVLRKNAFFVSPATKFSLAAWAGCCWVMQ